MPLNLGSLNDRCHIPISHLDDDAFLAGTVLGLAGPVIVADLSQRDCTG